MANKINYDSEFCGSLPLNHINVIQDYGYLLVADYDDFKLLQVSENARELLGAEPADLIGNPLMSFFDVSVLPDRPAKNGSEKKDRIPLSLTIGSKLYRALIHFKEDYLILEIEKSEFISERPFTAVYEEVKVAIAELELCGTVLDLSGTAVNRLKEVTGFDGVMMYRFDREWNGTVIAQAKSAPELEDYMGHTFPASDIPRQARELYLKNPYRLIPTRNYQPVRLYPVMNPLSNAFIDLSDCNLRGVAAVHLEYLQNMGVDSSMSIRVIYNGVLWGLIACHHTRPHYLNFELCSVCELLSAVISNRLTSILQKSYFEKEAALQKIHNEIIARVYATDDLTSLAENNRLLELFNANSMVAFIGEKYDAKGDVPDRDMMENLVLWLQSMPAGKIYFTDQLPEAFEEALPYASIASGLLAIPLDHEKGDYLFFFRQEVVETINWGGNPNQAIRFDADGKKYHPRASFQIWQETVHHTSIPWSEQETASAENLRSFIYEYKEKQKGA